MSLVARASRLVLLGKERRASAWLLAAAAVLLLGGRHRPTTPVHGYAVVRAWPRADRGFTQGLFWADGALYASTGLVGRSALRELDLASGRVRRAVDLDPPLFGEGAAAWGDRVAQLTWRSGVGVVYDRRTFARLAAFSYTGEGWGLTHDGTRLIMSDGTADLRFLDPDTFRETGRVRVTDDGRPVARLNELEVVRGEVLANVWQTDRIARIDPASGRVVGWIDLAGLLPVERRSGDPDDVLNGIAYDARRDRLFVTGKRWPAIFEVRLTSRR